jgi:HSP20 family protein
MAKTMKWDPFGDIMMLQDRINRVFDSTLTHPEQKEEETVTGAWAPPVDIYETGDHLILKAELPGINQKELDLRIENNTLRLKGERKLSNEVKREQYHRMERPYGPFTRSFTLPSFVDAEKISAEYKDGILTIIMPKREETRPKQISINVK